MTRLSRTIRYALLGSVLGLRAASACGYDGTVEKKTLIPESALVENTFAALVEAWSSVTT